METKGLHTSRSSPSLTVSRAEMDRHVVSRTTPPPPVQRRRPPQRSHSHEPPPLRDRLYTALSRFRYGWNFRSSVDIRPDVAMWLLGQCYHVGDRETQARSSQDIEGAPPHILAFLNHFRSLVWMTYRTNFPPIQGTSINTDCGWGCMVRSGQMILATALDRYLLGDQWRMATSTPEQRRQHRQILSWFADSPSHLCPFSLHSLMKVAVRLGNHPGDWFGPSQLAILIRECVLEAGKTHHPLENLLVYVAHDCTVYYGDVLKLYGERDDQSLLLLVPVRLGSETLNPIYIPCVQSLLTLDHCVGIIGGKPKHSVYFVGFQDDKLVHLDPHYCQVATEPPEDTHTYRDIDIKTYHCNTPRKLSASRMDPSCTIGFLCPNLQEFHRLRGEAEKMLAPPLQKGVYPFFSFSDLSLEEMLDSSVNMHLGSLVDDHLLLDLPSPQRGSGGRRIETNLDGLVFCDEEDFVVVECTRTSSDLLEVEETGFEDKSRGQFAEAEYLGVTSQGGGAWSGNGIQDEQGKESTRGIGNGDAAAASTATGHTSAASDYGHTSISKPHLGYPSQAPGLLPIPPPLDSDDSLPAADTDPFS